MAEYELQKTAKNSLKRKNGNESAVSSDTNNILEKKRARLESTIQEHNSYLLNEDTSSTSSVDSDLILRNLRELNNKSEKATESNSVQNDFEMFNKQPNPFSSKKSKSKQSSKTNKTSSKLKSKPENKNSSSRIELVETDFDKFLLGIDTNRLSKAATTAQKLVLKPNENMKKSTFIDTEERTESLRRLIDEQSESEEGEQGKGKKRKKKKPQQSAETDDEEKDPEDQLEIEPLSDEENSFSEYTTDDSEDEANYRKKAKRKAKNCLDDGDDAFYTRRLKELEKYERKKSDYDQDCDNYDMEELDEQDIVIRENNSNENIKPIGINTGHHFEVADCFRVPDTIWNQLYKFQKVGLRWLWELHQQKCGGILGNYVFLCKKALSHYVNMEN